MSRKRDFRTVSERDDDYPKALRELADRPPVLYVKGRWPLPDECLIGIVGTRHASPYGLEAARRLTTDLVQPADVTVSGLAAGIDACAHRATLEAERMDSGRSGTWIWLSVSEGKCAAL